MNHFKTVLGFGMPYLRRYWGRLLVGLLLALIYGLTNASFIWATRTLTGRFEVKKEKPAIHRTVDGGATNDVEAAATSKLAAEREKEQSTKSGMTEQWKKEMDRWAEDTVDPYLPRAGRELNWRQIVGVLLFLPMLVLVRATADFFSGYNMGWVSERVVRDMRLDLMDKLSTLSMDFFNRSTTGDLLTRINTDTTNLLRALRVGASDSVKEVITMFTAFGALLWLDWKLTLVVLVLLPLCMLPLFVLGKKARRASRASLKANVSQSSQLVELIAGIRVIKAFSLETEQLQRFRKTSDEMVHHGVKGVRARELANPVIEIISTIGLSVLILYVFTSGQSGKDIVGFLTGMFLFFLPIKKLAALHILFEQASVGVVRLQEIMDEKPTVQESLTPKVMKPFAAEVQFENVTFAYKDRTILHNFSLRIPRGARIGLAGETGSGKTTIVNLIYRFYDPASGSVKIDGTDLRDVKTTDLRSQMALVSQDIVIFDDTVAQNIACGKPGATQQEIEEAAKAASAHEFIMKLDHGYQSRVGERGVTLSGGQRQRLCIARAFIRNAPILVLDEATASLDSKVEAEIQSVIDRLSEHRTVICVAHRLATLANTDQVIVLSNGRIVEQGTYQELLRAGGTFASMAKLQGIFATA